MQTGACHQDQHPDEDEREHTGDRADQHASRPEQVDGEPDRPAVDSPRPGTGCAERRGQPWIVDRQPAFDAAPDTAWAKYVQRLVELDLGALSGALTEFVAHELPESVRRAQEITLAGVEDVLDSARSAGAVRADLGALELVLGIGMITRPQPAAIRTVAPDLVPRLVSIMLAGMRP